LVSHGRHAFCNAPVGGADDYRTPFPLCNPPWGIASLIVIFALFLVLSFALGIIIAILYQNAGLKITQSALLLASLASEGLLAVLVLYVVRIRYHSSLRILGLSGTSWRDLLYYGVCGGFVISLLMIVAISAFFSLFHLQPQPQPMVDLIVSVAHSRWLFLGSLLLAGIFAPICEEIYFRGFVYPVLRQRFGMPPAVLITSCLFAAIHFDLVRFLFLALLGAFLAMVCEKTRSLLPAIAAHSAYNLASIALLFLH
jgi:membrane protease YdiL (CAAX protease family)